MDGTDLLITLGLVVGAFALWLTGTALLIWGERRLVAKMQTRIGPNRLGPFGILQTIADGVKLFFKEDIEPAGVDRPVYYLAPFVSATVALLMFAVIPFGGTFTLEGREVTLQVWDPDIGMLWVFAMSSLGVYGIVLAGWASGSKYPLLGGVRSSAQMISYELAMSLSFAAVFVYVGSLQVSEIVSAQAGTLLGPIPAWNLFPMLPAFVLFFVTAVAETQRPPFDLPEAEGELVAGFHTEYSAAKFAMFFLAEFMNVITFSAVIVTLFLGGPSGWVPDAWVGTLPGALMGTFWFVVKTFVFVFVFVWLRATLPRVRYDRLMDLGWKVMLPFGLFWVLATGFAVVLRQTVTGATLFQVTLAAGIAIAVVLLVAPLFGGGGRKAPEARPEIEVKATSGRAAGDGRDAGATTVAADTRHAAGTADAADTTDAAGAGRTSAGSQE